MLEVNSHKSAIQVKRIFLNGYSDEVKSRYNKLELWDKLHKQGCDDVTISQALSVSRATIFRWKKYYDEDGPEGLQSVSRKPHKLRIAQEQLRIKPYILQLRKKYPLFGKYKIQVVLQEEYGISASVSTIGLVISGLIREKKILHVNDVCGKRIPKQWRKFDDHAQRYKYGMKAENIGEIVQIDHMSEGPYKHFAAICPISKFAYVKAYNKATAVNVQEFLQKAMLYFPFKIRSIQVDGGGEFRAEFEQICKKLSIPLYVLPPSSPKINGCVERSNGTFHYEFYALYPIFKDVAELNRNLSQFCRFYNEKRPHQRLNYLTPMRYLEYRKVFTS